jgi:N6-L-threonylcarbamoyladenine synthase
MRILGIETSCDETGIAVVEDGSKILASELASSASLHSEQGGIIPETAARQQALFFVPTLKKVLEKVPPSRIDTVSVAYGPGLVGPLLVGVEAAKSLSFAWGKPLVPVSHLLGHIYSAWLETDSPPSLPLIALIVSGGHTELALLDEERKLKQLGGTRDDAAGEVLDKTARLLGLGYPGGPAIERAAAKIEDSPIQLPKPMLDSTNYDFSFSGLKTAVANSLPSLQLDEQLVSQMAWAIQDSITSVLVKKTLRAAAEFGVNSIVLGGGVAANNYLRQKTRDQFSGKVFASDPAYSVDNGAMIAAAAFFNSNEVPWQEVRADPSILF